MVWFLSVDLNLFQTFCSFFFLFASVLDMSVQVYHYLILSLDLALVLFQDKYRFRFILVVAKSRFSSCSDEAFVKSTHRL